MVVSIFFLTGFNVTQMRLTGGVNQNEGRVELLINGRWGYIATRGMTYMETSNAAKVVCREMGYRYENKIKNSNYRCNMSMKVI
jgi:hypothetical protein